MIVYEQIVLMHFHNFSNWDTVRTIYAKLCNDVNALLWSKNHDNHLYTENRKRLGSYDWEQENWPYL